MKPSRFPAKKYSLGTSLLEVLVSIVIVALGLLGLAGLQAKMQVADMDAYQRTQAILLLEDMASRALANKTNQSSYVPSPAFSNTTITTLGTGDSQVADCTTLSSPTRQQLDACEWSNSLKGAAETLGTSKVGALIEARGCLQRTGDVLAGQRKQMVITVVWQGATPTVAPPAAVTCGLNAYNASCPSGDDRCRRAVTTTITTYNPLTL
ncbi:MAG: type IV pilus modification protein PilV [Pseudomonadota bacterium]|nr:type IV pilus modification protein PilV [Pseudomonadota bacterium]